MKTSLTPALKALQAVIGIKKTKIKTKPINIWELWTDIAMAMRNARNKDSIKFDDKKNNTQAKKIELVKISGMIQQTYWEMSVSETRMTRHKKDSHSMRGICG